MSLDYNSEAINVKKIVLLPLDERPCNQIYPEILFNQKDIELIQPSIEQLGIKKTPADFKVLKDFLLEACKEAYGLVISMDMLLYGGIVPSRLHDLTIDELSTRMKLVNDIKQKYPDLKIFAFDLIMRCPQYNSNDEEPDYYKDYGYNIFKKGFIEHRNELSIASKEELEQLKEIEIPEHVINDFLERRKKNLTMNIKTLELVKKQVIDFLVIPQDDAAEFGWTSKDQKEILEHIEENQIMSKVYLYPGADEVAMTLLSRMVNDIKDMKPKFFIKYPSPFAALTIPLLEDRYLDVTVRYQIRAAGGSVTDDVKDADIILFVNASGDKMFNNSYIELKRPLGLSHQRNLSDFVESMKEFKQMNKLVAIADVATINGSDHQLMQLLNEHHMLLEIDAYAGWNTSSNTLGTTIPFAIQKLLYPDSQKLKDFLILRYLEDYGYMSYARTKVTQKLKAYDMTYFDITKNESLVVKLIGQTIEEFIKVYLKDLEHHYVIKDIWMPWHRMFEVGLSVIYK
jgi:hypothetical protein